MRPANRLLRISPAGAKEERSAHISCVFVCARSAAPIPYCTQVENMTLTFATSLAARSGHLGVGDLTIDSMEGAGSSNGLDGYTALITAGGIGTRLLPFSKEIPKEMLPIIAHDRDDSLELKPLVQAIFEQLFSAGIRTFYIVVGRGKRAIEDHFSPDPSFLEFLEKKSKLPRGMSDFYEKIKSSKLVFLNQPEPLGFGDAVLLGQSLIDGPFIVQAADTLILSDRDAHIERLAGLHRKYHASATVLLRDVPDPRNYGVVEGDYLEPGVLGITSAAEKPETPRSNHAIMPVYVFSDEIFEALASTGPGRGGEIQLTDAIQRLAIAGKKVIGVLLHGDELMLDLGSPETMIEALKLSLRYADEKAHAASVAENLPRMPKPPRRRAAEMPSLRGPDASLPPLVPLMIEWRGARGREPAVG